MTMACILDGAMTKKILGWVKSGIMLDESFPTLGVTAEMNMTGQFGQTLPMRIAHPGHILGLQYNVYGGADKRDAGLLAGILARPDVVNFFGAGHGLGEQFMGMGSGAFKNWITHRYRFVFLDGCQTGTASLLQLWGADPAELQNPDFVTLDFYTSLAKKRLHHGAFLGWRSDTQIEYPTINSYQDPTTHQPCRWRAYEAYCNWHSLLIGNWENAGQTLATSIQAANDNGASVPSAVPALTPPDERGIPGWKFPVKTPTKDNRGMIMTIFNPANCLVRVGFGGLRFSGIDSYNRYADWPYD